MGRLEISEVLFSEVLKDNETKRIDSEYFRKQFLHFFKNVPNLRPLGDFVADGYRVVYENTEVLDEGVAKAKNYPIFLQATDLVTPFIDKSHLHYVSEQDWVRYPKGRIKRGEILIEVKGKVEKVAIVPDDFPEKTLVSGSLYKMSVNEKISKHVLLCYLISKYGVAFKDRYKTNLLISFISKSDLYRIPVPTFSQAFQNKIDDIFNRIFALQEESKKLYKQAQELLEMELNINHLQQQQQNVNIKSFSQSFASTGRLDAEYYQEKYYVAEEQIKKHGFVLAQDICSDINYGTVPTSPYTEDGSGVPYIKGLNLKDCLVSEEKLDSIVNTEALPARFYTKQGDIIISQMGTVADVGVVNAQQEGWLFASFTIRLRLKQHTGFDPYFVGLYIQDIAKEWYFMRNIAQASVRQNTDLPTVRNLYIPCISPDLQHQISSLIQQSFTLKAESKQLLEQAEALVEKEIEK